MYIFIDQKIKAIGIFILKMKLFKIAIYSSTEIVKLMGNSETILFKT